MAKTYIEELYERYVGAFDEWKIKLAFARLKRFGVPLDRWDDALQELSIAIHRFRFDPARAHAASEETILCRILDRRIKMLARSNARRRAMMDRFGLLAHRTEDTHLPEEKAMANEVRQLVADLSPRRQRICRLLMEGDGVVEVADKLGLHHETIRRHIQIIREAFAKRGLNPWSD
jgi:DNA-binding CsgD family transcriptional regulator